MKIRVKIESKQNKRRTEVVGNGGEKERHPKKNDQKEKGGRAARLRVTARLTTVAATMRTWLTVGRRRHDTADQFGIQRWRRRCKSSVRRCERPAGNRMDRRGRMNWADEGLQVRHEVAKIGNLELQ